MTGTAAAWTGTRPISSPPISRAPPGNPRAPEPSHAGGDATIAGRIADLLGAAGIEPVLDRRCCGPGDSFLSFMEGALDTSDYCLLLWSANAMRRHWVQVEWEAALHRSVTDQRAFLVVGQLDAQPLPMLLRPRLAVSLYPELEPGIRQLIECWCADRGAEQVTARPVADPRVDRDDLASPGVTVYVTSELFGITLPWQVDLDQPAGILLDEVRRGLSLPQRIGQPPLEFVVDYHLTGQDTGGQRLDRAGTLTRQGIRAGSVVWLETVTRPVLGSAGVSTAADGVLIFRSAQDRMALELRRHLVAAGLGR